MAWIKPTERDLASCLSQKEIDAFRQSPSATGAEDPVAALLAATAQQVRAAVRANRAVAMGPADTVPQSLMRAALAIAAFDALKRLPVPVGEDRRQAKDDALALLDKVAAGRITPESAGADDASANAAGPAWDESARFLAD